LILSSLLTNLFVIILISHFIGCAWYWVGTHFAQGRQSWVSVYLEGETWQYSYQTSYHWAVTQFTPGSMNVQPQNIYERVFTNLVLVLGLIIFSSIVSSITNATNRLRQLHSRYSIHLWELRKFFRQENISSTLLCRVTKYADAMIAPRLDHVSMHEVALLKLLPHSMHKEVVREIYARHLTCHPFFEEYARRDNAGMHAIYQHLTQMALAEQDVLFTCGHTATSMYFIITGSFNYHMAPGYAADPEILSAGMWCSEAVLWTHWIHQGTLQSTEASDVVALRGQVFRAELIKHVHSLDFTLEYGSKFIESMNALMIDEEEGSQCGSEESGQLQVPSDLYKLPSVGHLL